MYSIKYPVRLVDYSPSSPAGQLALDEALLNKREAEPGEGFLRFWEPREPFVVLGRTNDASREIRLDRCRALGIPVLRRSSGGGTVLQAPGCLNYSLILNIDADPGLSTPGGTNEFVLSRQALAIGRLTGKEVRVSGFSDLTIDDLKISGSAQRRRLRALLFHGSILLDVDFALVEEILPMPSREPAYRRARSHSEFLRNLHIPADNVSNALRASWGAESAETDLPIEEAARLARDPFSDPSWIYKQKAPA